MKGCFFASQLRMSGLFDGYDDDSKDSPNDDRKALLGLEIFVCILTGIVLFIFIIFVISKCRCCHCCISNDEPNGNVRRPNTRRHRNGTPRRNSVVKSFFATLSLRSFFKRFKASKDSDSMNIESSNISSTGNSETIPSQNPLSIFSRTENYRVPAPAYASHPTVNDMGYYDVEGIFHDRLITYSELSDETSTTFYDIESTIGEQNLDIPENVHLRSH